ncbi:MAG: hypothetical protein GC164_06035 [Phycisphaera sp.]|nr:hypothetical protein [Phycisphaera sp.]
MSEDDEQPQADQELPDEPFDGEWSPTPGPIGKAVAWFLLVVALLSVAALVGLMVLVVLN